MRAARSGTNPLTQKPFNTPATKVVRFSQAKGTDSFWSDLSKAKLYKGSGSKAAPKKEKPAKKDK